ncbi:MAG TPA: efflux RND transporter periplasmic adaptor subunit [Candidatus Acidoferrum sp.]|nr:efflux RND transporter periplasmic adaptor subunit [Candidatus Acidoferrum sp.]
MTLKSFAVLLIFSIALALEGCSTQGKDPRTQPPVVRLATVNSSSAGDPSFTGVVTSRVQSDLGFRVSGKVVRRYVDTGQLVHNGQPLMEIDVTDYAHAITNQAQTVAAARARADQSVADEARYRGLVGTGAVSASTYDQVKAAAEAAKAQLAALEAEEKVARDQGDYSLLVADADGTVVETLAEPGQVVAAGQTVVKLAHAGPREASIYLPETIRPALKSAAKATLYRQTKTVPAWLRQLSDAADPQTRTYEARYVLGGAGANAPLGSTVTVELPPSGSTEGLQVPIGSITDRGKGPGVWVFNEKSSTVSFRPVQVLRLGEEDAVISNGVRPGEKIVALGAHLLSDGQQIRMAEQEAATH